MRREGHAGGSDEGGNKKRRPRPHRRTRIANLQKSFENIEREIERLRRETAFRSPSCTTTSESGEDVTNVTREGRGAESESKRESSGGVTRMSRHRVGGDGFSPSSGLDRSPASFSSPEWERRGLNYSSGEDITSTTTGLFSAEDSSGLHHYADASLSHFSPASHLGPSSGLVHDE
mmetsp:Transcript_50718/g.130829  ORF Transcript_50718/g.130829 Transcript_50718/m.130829 type:complete len:176 (-) Transcript_50718:66-593(-)